MVLKLGYTTFIFIELGAKISKQYYKEVLLMQKMLQMVYSIARDGYDFL